MHNKVSLHDIKLQPGARWSNAETEKFSAESGFRKAKVALAGVNYLQYFAVGTQLVWSCEDSVWTGQPAFRSVLSGRSNNF